VKNYTEDTSKEYEDLVGYVAEENLEPSLADMLGEDVEYNPTAKKVERDSEFPEPWQTMKVNFRCMEDFVEFMELVGGKPVPRLKKFVFEAQPKTINLEDLFGESE
jgi:hypothetical protein